MSEIYTAKTRNRGFTLIELVIFIVLLGILAGGLLNAYNAVFWGTSNTTRLTTASELAAKCIGWYMGQRRIRGYSSINVSDTSTPGFCNTSLPGYNVTISVDDTVLPPDTASNYKTVKVNVSYDGVRQTSQSLVVGNY